MADAGPQGFADEGLEFGKRRDPLGILGDRSQGQRLVPLEHGGVQGHQLTKGARGVEGHSRSGTASAGQNLRWEETEASSQQSPRLLRTFEVAELHPRQDPNCGGIGP